MKEMEGESTRANLSVSAALFVKVQDCHHFGLQAIGMAAQLPTLVAICRQQLTLSRMILARHRGRKHVSYMNNKHQKSKCKNSHSLEWVLHGTKIANMSLTWITSIKKSNGQFGWHQWFTNHQGQNASTSGSKSQTFCCHCKMWLLEYIRHTDSLTEEIPHVTSNLITQRFGANG